MASLPQEERACSSLPTLSLPLPLSFLFSFRVPLDLCRRFALSVDDSPRRSSADNKYTRALIAGVAAATGEKENERKHDKCVRINDA